MNHARALSRLLLVASLAFCGYVIGFAQSPAPAKPADPPAKVALPSSPAKDALYSAIHKRDQADKDLTDLNLKLTQLQNQAAQQYQQLQARKQQADIAVDAARSEAYKAAKLDPAKFELNDETMEFTAKPEPAKEAKK